MLNDRSERNQVNQQGINRVETAREMMQTCEEMYQYVVGTITDINAEVARSTRTNEELTDIAHAINRASKFCEESRKVINRSHEIICNVVCFSWMMLPEHVNMEKCPTIRAKYALGIPDMKMHIRMPTLKKDPDKFIDLMAALGISKEAAVTGQVQIHYPTVCELAQRRFEQGLPNLPHVSTTDMWPVYKLTTRDLVPRKGETTIPDQEEN